MSGDMRLGLAAAAVWAGCVPAVVLVPAAPAGAAAPCAPPATEVVSGVPWAQTRLAPRSVWHLTQGEGVTVAVVGTGVDARVPQLHGRVLPGLDAGGGRADRDCAGHGTFVAGILAAAHTDGVGFAGVAPQASVLPVRLPDENRGDDVASLAAAVRVAVDAGADVVTVATGGFQVSRALRDVMAYAAARDVVIVAPANPAAKNAAVPDSQVSNRILLVSAVDPDGAAVGSGGPARVDLAAPGVDVLSLGPGGPGHRVASGAQYAVGFVAGAAALVRSYHPNLTAAQVKRRLTRTADPPGGQLPDPRLGWGTVNPYAAVAAVLPEETGGGAAVPPTPKVLAAPAPSTVDNRGRDLALAVAAAAAGLAAAVSLAATVVRHGRRRRWRPATAAWVDRDPVGFSRREWSSHRPAPGRSAPAAPRAA